MRKKLVVGCGVDGCKNPAYVEVILYDVYPAEGHVFFQQDFTCPYLCTTHMLENEMGARGERRPRGSVLYPFTNRERAQGFTVYRPLVQEPSN
jgi:hypothetical protein